MLKLLMGVGALAVGLLGWMYMGPSTKKMKTEPKSIHVELTPHETPEPKKEQK